MDMINEVFRGLKTLNDPARKFGIDLPKLCYYRGDTCSEEDLQNLAGWEADLIYERLFSGYGYDRIDSKKLQALLFDTSFRYGTPYTIEILIDALNLTRPEDCVLTPLILSSINAQPHPSFLYNKILAARTNSANGVMLEAVNGNGTAKTLRVELETLGYFISMAPKHDSETS